MRPGVALFPLDRAMALRAVRKIAARSGGIYFPEEISVRGGWFEHVTQRQIIKCFLDGAMTSDPRAGAPSFWECQMERFSAGLLVTVDFAIGPMGEDECIIVVSNITVR